MNLPNHIAIIMDGNGRWAKQRNLPVALGHKAGADALEKLVNDTADAGLKYLTVYAFSTENWNRSKEEVAALMNLFHVYKQNILDVCSKKNISISVIGDVSRFSESMQKGIKELVDAAKNNTGMHFTIALSYGGRDEIVRAIKKLKSSDIENLTEKSFGEFLDTAGTPDPDLLIRTSGEERISNFLLWQIAYSEIYITKTYWPDFTIEDLNLAVEDFNQRSRRFGKR